MIKPKSIWITPPLVPSSTQNELAAFSSVFQSVLYNRGIGSNQEAIDYLLPGEPKWFKELLPRGVYTAAKLIQSAINSNQKIAIYGDFDTDGITATALMTLALNFINADVISYIPDRQKEGYGLNKPAIDFLSDQGVKLLVTVDNGINAFDEVEYAIDKGLTVIITDHHQPDSNLPNAHVVINPKITDDPYPSKNLAGVGVAYKLLCALSTLYPVIEPEEYLDLVAIGTVADIVPLIGENRYLVRQGLSIINRSPRPGIRALLGASALSGKSILSSDISFQIAPRINSSGRLDEGTPSTPLHLLMSRDPIESGKLAQKLENDNDKRRFISKSLEKLLDEKIPDRTDIPSMLVYFDEAIPQGLAGIAAGYLSRKYNRPAVVGSVQIDKTVASCRSIAAFSIIDALSSISDLLIRYGGHHQAAGFTIDNSNQENVKSKLLDISDKLLKDSDLRPQLKVDAEVKLDDLNDSLYKELQKLEPTGEMNPLPVLVVRNLSAMKKSIIGKNKDHLKMIVTDGSVSMEAIGFGFGGISSSIPQSFDLAFNLTLNEFRGNRKLQLQIVDISPQNL